MRSVSRKRLAEAFVDLLDRYTKQEAIEALARFIIEERQTHEVDLIIREISRQLLHRKGHLMAEAISARRMSQALLDDVSNELKERTGAKTVSLSTHIESSLLGGMILVTPEFEIDTSVRRLLQQLEVS